MVTSGYMAIVLSGVLGAYALFLEFALFTDATPFTFIDINRKFTCFVNNLTQLKLILRIS